MYRTYNFQAPKKQISSDLNLANVDSVVETLMIAMDMFHLKGHGLFFKPFNFGSGDPKIDISNENTKTICYDHHTFSIEYQSEKGKHSVAVTVHAIDHTVHVTKMGKVTTQTPSRVGERGRVTK